MIIWFLAYYSFVSFNRYSSKIRNQPDGKAFSTIVKGLGLLTLTMPFITIISSLFSYIVRLYPVYVPMETIALNYISIIINLSAFYFIWKGSRELLKALQATPNKTFRLINIVCVLVVGIIVGYLALQNPIRTIPGPTGKATYYLPDILILLTIVLPNIFIWFFGFQSAINLNTYKQVVKGIFYKDALKYLIFGLSGVVFSSIFLQVLSTFSYTLLKLHLSSLLLLVYFLLVLIGIGYIYIAFGARKLKKIEEI